MILVWKLSPKLNTNIGAVRLTTKIRTSINKENEKLTITKSIKVKFFSPIHNFVRCFCSPSMFLLLAVVKKVIEVIEKPTKMPSSDMILFR